MKTNGSPHVEHQKCNSGRANTKQNPSYRLFLDAQILWPAATFMISTALFNIPYIQIYDFSHTDDVTFPYNVIASNKDHRRHVSIFSETFFSSDVYSL